MTREQQEVAVWRWVFERWYSREEVEQFRKRYLVAPTAPEAVWYDEPPFEEDGTHHPCWVLGEDRPGMVYWGSSQWLVVRVGSLCPEQLNGRRVSPITKPPEPTT